MKEKQYFTISEFSRLSDIGRRTLIYYDEIGLFSPELIAENGYRYYTPVQLDTAWLISTLKELGVPLKVIKEYAAQRTPEAFVALLLKEQQKVEREIQKLKQIQKEMQCYIDVTESSFGVDISLLQIQYFQEEPIFLGPPLLQPQGGKVVETIMNFFRSCAQKGQSIHFPLGLKISQENMKRGKIGIGDCYYLKDCDGQDKKPAGHYLVGYYYEFQNGASLYRRLLKYTETNHLQIIGDVFEDYLLNEVSVKDPKGYLVRVQVPIKNLSG